MKGIYAFLWKGIKEFFSSKEAVFWTFIFPLIFGLLFAGVFGQENPPQSIPVGIVPEEEGNTTLCNIFVENMKKVKIENKSLFQIYTYSTEDTALSKLKSGKMKSILIFDNNFTENITYGIGPGRIKVILDKRDIQDYQFVSSAIASYISQFENIIRKIKINVTLSHINEYGNLSEEEDAYVEEWLKSIVEPLDIQENIYKSESSARITRLWYLTAAIGITFVFSGMISASSLISSEIERGTARRLFTTKTKPWEMLAGNILVVLIIQLISAAIIVIAFILMFQEIIIFPPTVILMLIAAALSTVSLGLLFSGITKTQRAAAGIANAIAWPISFITGIFFPSFLLPEWMRNIGDYFPASALLRGIRMVVIYHQSIGNYLPQIAFAVVLTLVFLALGGIAFRWRMRTL